MRVFLIITLLSIVAAGCRTQRSPSDRAVPTAQLTSAEAKSLADVFIVASRGACGTAATTVEDAGEFWRVQTVYGLSERPGPELHIDKLTRKVSEVQVD